MEKRPFLRLRDTDASDFYICVSIMGIQSYKCDSAVIFHRAGKLYQRHQPVLKLEFS